MKANCLMPGREFNLLPKIDFELENYRACYDKVTALSIPGFKASANIVCLIGHNGSGKSTLLKSILGLHTPKTGCVKVHYQDSSKSFLLSPEQHMAFSPENGAVFADISVESYIRLWCKIKLGDKNYYKKKGHEFIESLSVEHLLSKLGRELSKGERRRVQATVGFMCQPRLFLFDEPFDGLDIVQGNNLAALIRHHSRHCCFIISSHRMEVVERLADTVVVLGRIPESEDEASENVHGQQVSRACDDISKRQLVPGRVVTSGSPAAVSSFLSGKSLLVQIREPSNQSFEAFMAALAVQLPSLVANLFGEQLIITGKGIQTSSITAIANSLRIEIESLKETIPSLTDAMTYHLQQLPITTFQLNHSNSE